MKERMLVLENGKVFRGQGLGSGGKSIAEIIFNTSVVGYQEIISDPANHGKMIVMTYPLIGNYGLTDEDYESKGIHISGLIVREYNDTPSNFRFTKTLGEVLEDNGIAGISGIDTRELTVILREQGTMKAMICDASEDPEGCVAELKAAKLPQSRVAEVSCKKIWYARTRNPIYTVVALDSGIKHSVINSLKESACNVVVVPYDTPKSVIMRYRPDGLFISNGPGSPEDVKPAIELIRSMKGTLPIFGVGMGSQLIALAYGAKTVKMKHGHYGGNHPIQSLSDGKVGVAAQNHSYAIVRDSLTGTGLEVSHINLTDGDIEGVRDEKNKVIGVQFEPEEGYQGFIDMMRAGGGSGNAQENRY
ncbi:MAG: glutamine-hydrolyzing carbamoyl-phosphate synthase small subunit [Clostridiales bacterium]|jgi:carbamoyl-phosphate synthase small subunit|nr:glutamine-hydrolyzing carbamoyl-phosphate synthase small subunit [Clostridiales bacterium]HOB64496.1 glutamine-hydrolyzing carbamoyl-phosphate synthase small subunit [Clostridia bacterium]